MTKKTADKSIVSQGLPPVDNTSARAQRAQARQQRTNFNLGGQSPPQVVMSNNSGSSGANNNANNNAGGGHAIPTAAEVTAWINGLPADQLQLFQAATQISQNANLTQVCATIAQAVGNGHKSMVLNTSAIKVPQFDKKRMTADYYFQELKKYFETQSHAESRHVYLLGTILDGTLKRWYENNVVAATTWDLCLASFKLEFDTRHDKSERLRLLVTRVQQSSEPVASYVYEMLFLASQVNPAEPMREKLRRAFEGLHADIYQTIRWNPDTNNPTAGSLIAAADDALRILHRRQELEVLGQNALPPLPDRSDESVTVKPEANDTDEVEQEDDCNHVDNHRYRRRDSHDVKHNDKENAPPSKDKREGDPSMRKGQHSNKNPEFRESSRERHRTGKYRQFNTDTAQVDKSVQCTQCKGFGHEESDCASKVRGVAMMFRHREVTCWQCGGEGHAYYHCSSEFVEQEEVDTSEEDYRDSE